MLNDILLIIVVLFGIIPMCFCVCYSCFNDNSKKERQRVILLLSDIREYLYSTGGDVIEERED